MIDKAGQSDQPLPDRPFKALGKTRRISSKRNGLTDRKNWLGTLINCLFPALPGKPLDFIVAMERLIAELTTSIQEFAQIKPDRILIGTTCSRGGRRRDMTWARIAAIRLGPDRSASRPPLHFEGQEYDYVITFCLPRFFNLPFEMKLATIIHELYHISPAADGTLRIMGRRKYAHGSRKRFENEVDMLLQKALANSALQMYYEFLHYDYKILLKRHGSILIRPILLRQIRQTVKPEEG